ncbi:MAG: hypothetical protein QME96_18220 [Myxococcota bacterium]|nr:hypothetical protein [Myxococcota bacterium]
MRAVTSPCGLRSAAAFAAAILFFAAGRADGAERSHQLSASLGIPLCASNRADDIVYADQDTDAGCNGGNGVWLNLPILYRYRVNDILAAGGGLMLAAFAPAIGIGPIGGAAIGTLRAYFNCEYVSLDLSVMLGAPMVAGLGLAFVLALPLTETVWLSLENRLLVLFPVLTAVAVYEPLLSVEVRL